MVMPSFTSCPMVSVSTPSRASWVASSWRMSSARFSSSLRIAPLMDARSTIFRGSVAVPDAGNARSSRSPFPRAAVASQARATDAAATSGASLPARSDRALK